MNHDFLEGLLRHTFEFIEVPAQIVVTPAELLDLLPDFVVMVTANSLAYIEVIGEVAEVDRPVVP